MEGTDFRSRWRKGDNELGGRRHYPRHAREGCGGWDDNRTLIFTFAVVAVDSHLLADRALSIVLGVESSQIFDSCLVLLFLQVGLRNNVQALGNLLGVTRGRLRQLSEGSLPELFKCLNGAGMPVLSHAEGRHKDRSELLQYPNLGRQRLEADKYRLVERKDLHNRVRKLSRPQRSNVRRPSIPPPSRSDSRP